MTRDEEARIESNPLLNPTASVSKSERLLYYLTWLWRVCIFAVTGSSSVAVTRTILTRAFRLEAGTLYYYAIFFFLELAVYTVMLILIGTCLGQWKFFCRIAFKMWSWALPKHIRKQRYDRLSYNT